MYLFTYFKTESEAMYYATCKDGYHFEPYGKQAILEATVGNLSIRDPFIFQDQEGIYHLLSTDSWKSTKIIHATSKNLLDWSEQTLIGVMDSVENTLNTWAPECVYDKENDQYVIFWSSTIGVKSNGHRIWAVTSKDFKSYSEPFILFDPGYNVIDANIIYHNNEYYMTFKDERGENKRGTEHKRLRTAKSVNALGPYEHISEEFGPELVEGPTVFKVGNELRMLYDHFEDPFYGSSVFDKKWTVNRDKFNIPADARHGSVIEIDDEILKS